MDELTGAIEHDELTVDEFNSNIVTQTQLHGKTSASADADNPDFSGSHEWIRQDTNARVPPTRQSPWVPRLRTVAGLRQQGDTLALQVQGRQAAGA